MVALIILLFQHIMGSIPESSSATIGQLLGDFTTSLKYAYDLKDSE